MPSKLTKRTINIDWEDFEGTPQKLVLKRPKSRDLKYLRSALIPFHVKIEKIKNDPDSIDDSVSNMDIEIVRVLVSRLKESSTISLDTEDDWLDLDAGDMNTLFDLILDKCNYFLVGSQNLKKG